MKELNSFTVERLEELARAKMISGYDIADIRALAAIVLAAKMAEPVAWVVGDATLYNSDTVEAYAKRSGLPVSPLYTTPQLNSPEMPDGWKLVPIEPTLAMLTLLGLTGSFESMLERYANMLDAAPERENG
ncbi:TPA: hypothetical protein ACUU9N_001509 [Yersinia enterocolitica]